MEPLAIELGRGLFSAELVERVKQSVAGRMVLETVAADEEKLTIHVIPVSASSSADSERHYFYEALSDVLMEHLAVEADGHTPQPLRLHPVRMVDVTLHVIAEGNDRTIVLSADPAVHFPTILLHAVAPLKDRARIRLESTNPVDRAVIVVELGKDDLISYVVAQILRRLIDEVPS